jgi:hypothetical protein
MDSSSEASAAGALAAGLRRTGTAPAILIGTFVLTLAMTFPLSLVVRDMIAAHLGASTMADSAARGVNYEWWQEFSAQASAIGTTFIPQIIGFSAVVLNAASLLDNARPVATVGGVIAAWLVLWSFLSGGILDRYARNRRIRARGFFAACGAHAGAILRLGLIALLMYWFLFAWVHPRLFGRAYGALTHDAAVERNAFAVRLTLYGVFLLLLAAVNIVIDYARVRIVVEDRRSAFGAVLASVRFVRRNIAAAAGLYSLNVLLFLIVIALYAAAAPRATAPVAATLFVGEVYILARHYLKLTFYASETALFQARLAHAAYTASPALQWPDSPAAEAIANAAAVDVR